MKKLYSFIAVPFIVFFMLFFSNSALANIPSTYTGCTSGCTSWQWWNGYQQGFMLDTTMSNPSLSNSVSSWIRTFQVFDYVQGNAAFQAKFIKTKGVMSECPIGGPYFELDFIDTSGTEVRAQCAATIATDWNQPVHVQIWLNSLGCMQGEIVGASTRVDLNSCGFNNIETTYNRIQYSHYIVDTITGHKVYGVDDAYNKYYEASNNTWSYQTRISDTIHDNLRPKMYWRDVPASGNNGGRLSNCIYEDGTGCTLGA